MNWRRTLLAESMSHAPGQTELADQTILQHAPEAFDAAFGLGRSCAAMKVMPSWARVRPNCLAPASAGEFFFDGPVVIVAHEDAAAIAVEGQGDTEAREQAAEQVEIALGGFCGKELKRRGFCRWRRLENLRAVSWGPRPSSQSWGLPSSKTISPGRAERTRRWR